MFEITEIIDLAIVVPNGKTVYLNLIMPDGTILTSDAMTYGMYMD